MLTDERRKELEKIIVEQNAIINGDWLPPVNESVKEEVTGVALKKKELAERELEAVKESLNK